MACFLVPMALAIVTTIIQISARGIGKKLKLSVLNGLLWGGVILLAAEHVWHAEITAWPPYLTAMATPADTAVMLSEMASVGTSMAVAISITWATMLAITTLRTNRIAIKDQLSPLSKPMTTTK
ncbi:MAG: hypothetical protein NWF05_01145 [Candidatus Bathyarchaeota archaeon]|nr:hypothetical protein [Candidatus Bathyarchaeota archaeon]